MEDRDSKIVKYVVSEFERYEAHWADHFKEMEKIYDNWIGIPPKKELDWSNNVHVPLTFEGEQTLTPRIVTALFSNEAPIDVQVEGDSDPEQGSKIKHLLQHVFRVAEVQSESFPSLTQNTLFGTGYCYAGGWLVKRGWQMDSEGKRYYTIIESRPDFKHVDLFELFPHPDKLEVGDNKPLIRRQFMDAETFKSMVENPFFKFENMDEAIKSDITNSTIAGVSHYQPRKGEVYELLTYWGPFDDEITLEEKQVTRKAVPYQIMVINRKIKIRCVPNPYNHQKEPFVRMKFFIDAKPSWFGVGVGKVGLASQERVNKIVNQRLDNVDLVMNKQGFYNGNDPLINVKKLQQSTPGLWRKVSDTVNSIRWMETPDVTQSSYVEEEKAKADFREVTGATVQLMPSDQVGDQHRTAMGIQLLQGAAGMRFRPVLRKLETDFIQATAMFFFSNLNQFMSADEWVQVTGENGESKPVRITPEDIQAKVYFIPTGLSETVNKETQVGQLLRFKEVTVNDPTINRAEINKRIAELMGFKDSQKLLVPQAPPGASASGGGLTSEQQNMIMRRMKEGASEDQIAEEVLGAPPQ
jgi:hypothetical protein